MKVVNKEIQIVMIEIIIQIINRNFKVKAINCDKTFEKCKQKTYSQQQEIIE